MIIIIKYYCFRRFFPRRSESNHENPTIYQNIRNNNGKHFEKFKFIVF